MLNAARRRLREAADYADTQRGTSAQQFRIAIGLLVLIATLFGALGVLFLASGQDGARDAAAGGILGFFAVNAVAAGLVLRWSRKRRYRAGDD